MGAAEHCQRDHLRASSFLCRAGGGRRSGCRVSPDVHISVPQRSSSLGRPTNSIFDRLGLSHASDYDD